MLTFRNEAVIARAKYAKNRVASIGRGSAKAPARTQNPRVRKTVTYIFALVVIDDWKVALW
jgi:hypothetical protein